MQDDAVSSCIAAGGISSSDSIIPVCLMTPAIGEGYSALALSFTHA